MTKLKRLQMRMDETRLSNQKVDVDEYEFYRICRISLSDELAKDDIHKHFNECLIRFISSLAGTSSPIVFRVLSKRKDQSISIYLGARKKGQSLAERFRSYFQGVEYELVGGDNIEQFACQALVTGIPTRSETEKFAYIEPFVRWIRNKDIMLEIVAKPVHSNITLLQLQSVIEQRTNNSESLTHSESNSKADSETWSSTSGRTSTQGNNHGGALVVSTGVSSSEGTTDTTSDTTGMTETRTSNVERTNYQAVELDRLLELHTERLQRALSSGLWKTTVSIFAQDKNQLATACEIYESAYLANAVEPYQAFPLSQVYRPIGWIENEDLRQSIHIFHEQFREFSFLTGEELSDMIDMPKEEYNGYEFIQEARFSQNPLSGSGISLGHIIDGNMRTSTEFHLESNQFVKHLLVAGITGSGKTNTIFNLLTNLAVPFLIIEPAKREYRGLKSMYPNLRVYTLGNERVSPFRINPFYFPPHVNIQQHMDNLKVIFNSSFTMYASMPNILEQCITNVYIKKGWSLTTSRNIYQTDEAQYYRYFPTIEDLYYEIDRYTTELGYAQEQTQNIRAALLTRIKSLMAGGKGRMLNTIETMDVEELLKYPTVLELEAVADDDEKSLVIGLISVFIYEFLKAREIEYTGELKHLLILEEAHRIFANESQQGSQEDVNIKGKAVESLSHILSEIRAYGEGMIIVDQVPTKLAPDVLKNTNTKIIHRIVSKDDAEYVANSLGLPDERVHFVSKLKNGSALVFTDGMNAPVHLQIHHSKRSVRHLSDREVAEHSRSYHSISDNSMQSHPLTELLAQNLSGFSKLVEPAEQFYRAILAEPLQKLHSNYQAAKRRIVAEAEMYGFDLNMNVDVDEFVFTWMRESLLRFVKEDDKISRQINRQIYMERYVEAILEMLGKDYETHRKEFALLELNQFRLRGDRIG